MRAQIGIADIASVGGKNASLGELFNALKPKGIGVLDGFATTAAAYRLFLSRTGLEERLARVLAGLDPKDVAGGARRGIRLRDLVMPVWAEFYHRVVFERPATGEARALLVANAEDVVTALKGCGLRHMDRRLRLTAYLERVLDDVPHPLPSLLTVAASAA